MILFAQKQQQLIVGGWVWFLDSREAQSIHPLQKRNWELEERIHEKPFPLITVVLTIL
jgi:hypothetical protein